MSRSLRLFRSNILSCINPFTRNTSLNGVTAPITCRFLYSKNSIGINSYETYRCNIRAQFMNVENVFRSKMEDVCKDENSMIFTEDLKAMLHLAQKTPADLDLLMKMMYKFNMQNKELRFGAFIFGPVVMRTFYYLDEPDRALNAFKDPNLENFFDQLSSFQILMTLLYNHEKYAEMREVYEIIRNKHLDGITHPKHCTILVLAACYKENTPNTLQYALDLWKEFQTRGFLFTRRSIFFTAALALNQNLPQVTLEILSTLKEQSFIVNRCLKVLAFMKINRYMDILSMFKKSLESYTIGQRKELYFEDVIKTLEEHLNVQQDAEMAEEILEAIQQLRSHERIVEKTLDAYLCQEIDVQKDFSNRKYISQHGMPRTHVQQRKRQPLRELL